MDARPVGLHAMLDRAALPHYASCRSRPACLRLFASRPLATATTQLASRGARDGRRLLWSG
eukprot:6210534-Pleurochrysis_carterae.AAC.1